MLKVIIGSGTYNTSKPTDFVVPGQLRIWGDGERGTDETGSIWVCPCTLPSRVKRCLVYFVWTYACGPLLMSSLHYTGLSNNHTFNTPYDTALQLPIIATFLGSSNMFSAVVHLKYFFWRLWNHSPTIDKYKQAQISVWKANPVPKIMRKCSLFFEITVANYGIFLHSLFDLTFLSW